ncbi:MAG TPA: glycerol kinase GlpK [Thermoanaerobaculia bacterium]|jgi:glycerol kinase|nr:glycerol kinase GlpK [Thermoanaerobaculia bacterium]
MPFVLALDQGTTSSRAIVFDDSGSAVAMAQREIQQIFPRPGWVEHDPQEIWDSQLATAREALARAGIAAGDVAALGITNQRETTILWDRRTGLPLANAIVWQDRRTAGACDRLKRAGLESLFRERTGLVLDPYFSGTKLAWLLDEIPGARAAAEAGHLAFGTVDSWLLWNLTGGRHATDVTNASRTLLWNLHTGDWDDELLAALDIPRSLLPEVLSSSEVYGETVSGLLGASIPIAGIAGDQQAALFGQACLAPGMVKNTYGTGCFLLMNTGERPIPSRHELITTPAWQLSGSSAGSAAGSTAFALEGSVFVAGAVVQWLRDGLGLIRSAAEVEALAASVPDAGGVILVPAFTGLGAPHWDAYARGALVGITRGTTAAHIARAALEGIAFQVADVLSAMEADSGLPTAELRVDGGATVNNLLMQIQADLTGVPVVRPRVQETTALGAAYLAGLATGVWKSTDEISDRWQVERTFEPALDSRVAAERRARWNRAVERARGWEEEAPP